MNEYNLGLHKPMPNDAKNVFNGTIFSLWQWNQRLFDGSKQLFERATRSDVTHAVGVLPDGRILLTEDRQPHRKAVITPPGGKVEQGETPEEAVRREFMEETGYEIETLIPWHHYKPANDKLSTLAGLMWRETSENHVSLNLKQVKKSKFCFILGMSF
jgi:hypothetical protein